MISTKENLYYMKLTVSFCYFNLHSEKDFYLKTIISSFENIETREVNNTCTIFRFNFNDFLILIDIYV